MSGWGLMDAARSSWRFEVKYGPLLLSMPAHLCAEDKQDLIEWLRIIHKVIARMPDMPVKGSSAGAD